MRADQGRSQFEAAGWGQDQGVRVKPVMQGSGDGEMGGGVEVIT